MMRLQGENSSDDQARNALMGEVSKVSYLKTIEVSVISVLAALFVALLPVPVRASTRLPDP
jgi:hypothetical protein